MLHDETKGIAATASSTYLTHSVPDPQVLYCIESATRLAKDFP